MNFKRLIFNYCAGNNYLHKETAKIISDFIRATGLEAKPGGVWFDNWGLGSRKDEKKYGVYGVYLSAVTLYFDIPKSKVKAEARFLFDKESFDFKWGFVSRSRYNPFLEVWVRDIYCIDYANGWEDSKFFGYELKKGVSKVAGKKFSAARKYADKILGETLKEVKNGSTVED